MAERGFTWYKRDPIRFMDGVEGMGPELIGAYAFVLDLIYARGGKSKRDDAALGGRMGCSKRKAGALVDALIERGKIEVHGEYLTHKHAEEHANTTRAISEKRANAGRKGGEKRPRCKENKDLAQASASSENKQIREDKIREDKNTPQTPQGGSEPEGFAEFWKAYPRRVGKGQARKAYAKAIKSNDPSFLIAEAQKFAKRMRGQDPRYIPHPSTWLNGERWLDEEKAPVDFLSEKERREQEEKRKKRAFYERVIAKYGDAQ